MDRHTTEPLIAPTGQATNRRVEVLEKSMRIRDLSIERPEIISYLMGIAPDKQEIALVHAMQVGITEILARRPRSRPAS
jgi:hypothetical protein